MKKDEAVKVMTDVALRRKPHSRAAIKIALATLEPSANPLASPSPKDAAHIQLAKTAAIDAAEAKAVKFAEEAETAKARAKEMADIAKAVKSEKPAAEPEPVS